MAKKEEKDVVKKEIKKGIFEKEKDKNIIKKTKTSTKKQSINSEVEKKFNQKSSKVKKPTKLTASKSASHTKISRVKTSPKNKSINKSTAKTMLAEYYDLPYRYNQTIVKILAQTPTTLFVYWDISDNDRNSLILKYGENFFNDTKPILVVHNLTKNYSFEIEINDFANSWYIRTQEPNCDYVIELGRKFYNKQSQEYVYIHSSNDIVSPNDHILIEKANLGNVLFKNIKTQKLSSKNFGSLRFINDIDKLYGNIYDVYSALYDDEILNELTGPSSGEFYLNK